MANPANRLITLLMILQSRSNQNARKLAGELGVSIRTIHRYVSMLEEMGIPIYCEHGPYGGFSLMRGYKLPPMVFTNQEAVALSLGLDLVDEMWGRIYREASCGARAKLENVLPDEQRAEIKQAQRSMISSGLNQVSPEVSAPILEILRSAIGQSLCVRFQYTGQSGNVTHRMVAPYTLLHRWGWWYLVGYCFLRNSVRIFRLDRLDEVMVTEDKYKIPEDFNIHTYLEYEFNPPPENMVCLQLSSSSSSIATSNPSWWNSIMENEDGSVEVTFTTTDWDWTARNILGFGPGVKVIHPEHLAQLVGRMAEAIHSQYKNIGDKNVKVQYKT